MTKDEEGPYNEASHIGWSGKVLRLNNYVFFIAQNNYLPLTSSDVGNLLGFLRNALS